MTLKWKNKNKQKMSDLLLYQSGPPLWGLDHPVGIQPTVGDFLSHFIWFTVVCRCLFTDVTQTLCKAKVSHRCARSKTLECESSPFCFACDSHSCKPYVPCRCSQCKITFCTGHMRYMFNIALDFKISTHLKKTKKR